jgi:iron complex outermembrane receptor protein
MTGQDLPLGEESVHSHSDSYLRPIAAGLLALLPFAVLAADAVAASDELAEVVVTGSLIRGVTQTGSPVVSFDAEQIKEGGFFNTTEVLRSIPQVLNLGATDSQTITAASIAALNQASSNGTNLRGLGTASTLTLVNGHRSAPSGSNGQLFDAATIPSLAISRIDVVVDGTSALYGSDAVAGVVNVGLKSDFNGATTQFSGGGGNGVHQWSASQLFGKTWGSGSVTATFEHSYRNHVEATEQPGAFNSNPYDYGVVPATGYLTGAVGIGNSNPGNILVTAGTFGGVACSAAAPCLFGIPTNQNGSNLTGAALPATPGAAVNQYTGANLRNGYQGYTLLPQQKRDTLVLVVKQAMGDRFKFGGEILSTKRDFRRQQPALAVNLAIPNSNPYSPCNLTKTNRPAYCGATATSTISVPYFFGQYAPPQISTGYSKNTTATATVEAELIHGWRGELGYTYSKNQDDRLAANSANTNNTNLDRYNLANGSFVNGFNPFIGDGTYSAANQALVDKFLSYNDVNVSYLLKNITARFDGPVWTLPGGELKAAVGVEHRTDLFTRTQTGTQLSGTGLVNSSGVLLGFSRNAQDVQTINPPPSDRKVDSAYLELFAPIVGDNNAVPLVKALNLSLAGRHENNNRYGSSDTPKVGLTWTVIEGLQLNATHGKSFRAPALPEVDTYQGNPTCYTGNSIFCAAQTGFNGLALPAGQTILMVGGGNPNLAPETATTSTVGFSFHPTSLPGLDLTVGYYDIKYTNRIGNVLQGITSIVSNPLYTSLILAGSATQPPTAAEVTQWLNYIGANTIGLNGGTPAGNPTVVAIVDNRVQNAGILQTRGIDFSGHYTWDSAVGRWNAGLSGTMVNSWRNAIAPGLPLVESVNTNNSTGASPNPLRLRARGSLGWRRGSAGLTGVANYTGSYTNNNNLGIANGQLNANQGVGSYTTVDLNAAYDFGATGGGLLRDFRLQLNVQNLFDRAPPYVLFYTGAYYTKFDPQNASAVGRQISLQLSKGW